ncbi:MAG: UPF0147 family protein [Nanoarchaeota archaeon]|nr:UPF0147 family protein [Nanoarchaeota archaeon]
MERGVVTELLRDILEDHGVPRNIKSSIEETLKILDSPATYQEKIATIVGILDEASGNPNISPYTRTNIWNVVSFLEGEKSLAIGNR